MINANNVLAEYPKVVSKLPETDRNGANAIRTFSEANTFIKDNQNAKLDRMDELKDVFAQKVNEALTSVGANSQPQSKSGGSGERESILNEIAAFKIELKYASNSETETILNEIAAFEIELKYL